jgi:putative ABC transport system substrate-binding protein
MKRRDFITLIGVAATWPLAARAQQPAMPVIGFLNSSAPDADGDRMRAYRKALSETGYVPERDI